MKYGRLVPLCALVLWVFFCCKGLPVADTGEGEPPVYGDESSGGADFGLYDYGDWDMEAEDPSLALPPDIPSDAWPWDLIEPSLENGEAVLPDLPPEEAAIVLAEPLPEPAAPDLPEPDSSPEAPPPELAEEPSPEEPALEESPPLEESLDLAGEAPEEEPLPPPEPELPPPPPRIVRPSEPIPPPPPARETVPMPPLSVPDLPARNPPTLVPAPPPSPGVSSRVVQALAGQTVEIPFRGAGWVYLGEASSKRGMDYASRRLDAEGQTFVFRAVDPGVYELKFYRQDFIRDYIINDVVTVVVGEPPLALPSSPSSRFGPAVDRGVVVAEPRWPVIASRTGPETGPAAPEPQAGSPSPASGAADPSGTAVPDTPGGASVAARAPVEAGGAVAVGDAESAAAEPSLLLPRDTAAEEYMRRAREEYQGGRYPQAMAILDQFLERFPLGSDEAWWLYAQICEKQGPSRNIRLALDYYRRLTAEYPQSSHYREARRRIAYLERYYINIQ